MHFNMTFLSPQKNISIVTESNRKINRLDERSFNSIKRTFAVAFAGDQLLNLEVICRLACQRPALKTSVRRLCQTR